MNIETGPLLFTFTSFQNWVGTARWKYQEAGVRGADTICVDQRGRLCGWGKHFMTARDEGAFPLSVYLLREDMQQRTYE